MSDVALLLQWLRQVVDRDRGDVVVMRRALSPVEAAAERIVRHSVRASVERVDDPAAEVAGCDGWAVGVRRLDPVPLAVVRAGEESGVPGVCRHQDGYPFRDDAGSRASQAAAHRTERARAVRAREDARDRARAATQRRRTPSIPTQRSVRPGEARQRAWDAHLARQGADG